MESRTQVNFVLIAIFRKIPYTMAKMTDIWDVLTYKL